MMNRIEMAQRLFNDPKLKAKDEDGDIVCCKVFKNGHKVIKWESDEDTLCLCDNKKETWEIIEPQRKLKEMTFGEAMYHFNNDTHRGNDYNANIDASEVVSILTGETLEMFTRSLEVYSGLWTIKGIYEEE